MSDAVNEVVLLSPVKRGDTWTQVFTWLQDGEPLDITDAHAALQLRRKNATTPALDISDEEGSLVIDGPNGTVTLRVEAEDMADVAPARYYGDLELTLAGTPTTTISSQTFIIQVVEDQTR